MVVLITGAASGIGSALAQAFALKGHTLVLADIDEQGMEKTAEAIRGSGGKSFSYVVDVTDPVQVQNFQAKVEEEVGVPDLLINNAGVGISGDFVETPLEEWRWLMGVNLWGYVHMLHAFLPSMIKRESGHVVNVASVGGLTGLPTSSAYSASKFAVVGLTEALWNELRNKGIKVTLVCPSYVRTAMYENTHLFGYDQRYIDFVKRFTIEPEKAVAEIVRGIEKGKFMVITGLPGKIGYYTKRLSTRVALEIQGVFNRKYQKYRG